MPAISDQSDNFAAMGRCCLLRQLCDFSSNASWEP